ncbi:hypothetical protein TEA_020331 [Camellia sinensis var. sinensis]|uniref:C2 domain-containing protein n=2 Tax=Camellia sinensis TaxID=4442 RepID=A0A4S4CZ32_CAMSN|nr:hypothetical protein TEA_020331 [Camellia sinensis var. sinensis]
MQSGKFVVCRKFQVILISASDLEDVRKVFKMKVHARVSINSLAEKRTEADKHGGTSPKWSCTVEYTIGEYAVIQQGVMLVIKLYCERKLGDKYVGEPYRRWQMCIGTISLTYRIQADTYRESAVTDVKFILTGIPVHTSIKELFDSSIKNGGNCSGAMTCPVHKGSKGVQGTLTFSYRFGDRITVKRPSKWKKLLQFGAVVLLRLALSSVDMEIEEIPIFTDPDVIE